MLANFLMHAHCPIPIQRLGDGFYLFGSKKIYAKVINGKLVIRVGGGYMVIEQFIETYAEEEMAKLQRIADKQGVGHWQNLDFNQFIPANHPMKNGSPRASKGSKLNGSSRHKSATTNQLKHGRRL